MRDDDRIMRDVEKIPEQTHRKGRVAILERKLGLVPLSGYASIVGAARETRYRIMGELSAEWNRRYANRSAVMKPGLLDALKRKDAEFWFQHRDSTPEQAFLSELFELKPFAGDSPLTADARLARYRIMGELSAEWRRKYAKRSAVMKPGLLRDLARKEAEFWFQHRDSTPEQAFLSELFELKPIAGDSPLMADARSARYRLLSELFKLRLKAEAVQMAGKALSQKSPQFWYEHMNFSADELIELHFPDIQNWKTPSERSARAEIIALGCVSLVIAALFFGWFLDIDPYDVGKLGCILALSVVFLATALIALFSRKSKK